MVTGNDIQTITGTGPENLGTVIPKTILSLFDYSGEWSQPYIDAGYNVIQIDKQIEGIDINDFCVAYIAEEIGLPPFVHGIIAAPPCTHFTTACNRLWKDKDADGRTDTDLNLVRKVLATVDYYQDTAEDVKEFALKWWVLENPVGRLNTLLPYLKEFGPRYFHPYEFGDPYTKKTGLWGEFAFPEKNPVEPIRTCAQGSWLQKLGGKSQATKNARSKTPPGFAQAFFEANR